VADIVVIIVNYNGGDFLRRCLLSLTMQVKRPSKVIVVDNNSEDDSAKAAAADSSVELIKLDKNLGFAAAVNLGVAHADTADWIALLNPDAFAEPEWLACFDLAIHEYPAYSSFASRMMCHQRPGYMDGAGDAYHISGRPWRISHGKLCSSKDLRSSEVFGPCGGAAVYQREKFVALGGFDEDYFCYLEDVDFSFRSQLHGEKCLYLPNAVVSHIGSAITGRGSDFQVYYGQRNIVWTYCKNMPTSLLIFSLPLHLGMNILAVLVFTCRGQGKVVLRAKYDALLGLPKILRKRRRNMDQYSSSATAILRVMRLAFFKT
jgi:GT2 family glycosyltransferase